MVVVLPAPPALSGQLDVFYTTDPLLYNSPLLVFYGQAASVSSASTRIQVHIFTPAGLESFTRLSISPNSPYYAAVAALPREEQGDEVCRGIAYALSKYFSELSSRARDCWTSQAGHAKAAASPSGLFSDTHVAVLASRLTRVDNSTEAIAIVRRALGEQVLSWLDVDVVLPPGSVQAIDVETQADLSDGDLCRRKYGRYAPIITALGEPSFLPTSKMRRAASKPTMLGRAASFRPGQRETIRKEMCELVDTEESYHQKLATLIEGVGTAVKNQAEHEQQDNQDIRPILSQIFPASLSVMLEKSQKFLDSLRSVLDFTEESAMTEIEKEVTAKETTTDWSADSLGVIAMARVLLDHFPHFADAYSAYMSTNAATTKLVKSIMNSPHQGIIDTIHAFGEQKLTSLLIEPVQRLPRYTLYIDSISKQLPVGHPALMSLLRARDIVTNICLSDDEVAKAAEVRNRLAALIDGFGNNQEDQARLVSFIDVARLDTPYDHDVKASEHGILMLFTDRVIYVEKLDPLASSARMLQNEVEKPAHLSTGVSSPGVVVKTLKAVAEFFLDDTTMTHSADGKAFCLLTPAGEDVSDESPPYTFLLEGQYAGKASILAEELAKARVEGRFTEDVRESAKWEVRSATGNTDELNMFSAVFEHGQSAEYPGHIRIEVDLKAVDGSAPVETRIKVTPGGNTFCHVAMQSRYGNLDREKSAMTELLQGITRRVLPTLQAQLSMKDSPYMASFVARNRSILDSLNLVLDKDAINPPAVSKLTAPKAMRPPSPVKTLSSFLSSRTSSHPAVLKKADSALSVMPNLAPKNSQLPRPGSGSRPSSKDDTSVVQPVLEPSRLAANKLKRLEDIMSTYLLALQARKGNVVGRVIKMRGNAGPAEVNELYNALLEDPNMMVLAAQASVDVLFAAFEKFLSIDWRNKLGPVMDKTMLAQIQHQAESSFPTDFEAFFLNRYLDLSPQNQRALKGIVKLLAELLDGAGNDGDRGILTAAFTELIVPNDDPMPYISLMDRFVDDMESLFGESIKGRMSAPGTPSMGHGRSQSATIGSVNSNTSSLRKKFGFGGSISSHNSRPEHESKVGSVWRSLSKNKQTVEPMTPRAVVQRTKSTDTDVRESLKRPVSQDRPAALGQFAFERPSSQDSGFLLSTPLSTIGEGGTPRTGPPKKKRRSSLSDLTSLQSPDTSPVRPSPASTRLQTIADESKDMVTDSPSRIASPARTPQRSRLPSSFRKENSPGQGSQLGTGLPRPSSRGKPAEVKITSFAAAPSPSTTARPTSASKNVPAPLRVGLSERSSANAMKIKQSPADSEAKTLVATQKTLPAPTKKLRIQSPQRLRERLQSEQRELQSTSAVLQDELSKLGDAISGLTTIPAGHVPARAGSIRATSKPLSPLTTPAPENASTAADALTRMIATLSASMTARLDEMQARNKALQDETLSALILSEARTRRLDELYREANAENEVLYARFNDELGKVVRMVRGGEGVEELKRRLKSGEEEMEGLRRERARLRREVVGLRGRLGE